jgi:hypothetical protein
MCGALTTASGPKTCTPSEAAATMSVVKLWKRKQAPAPRPIDVERLHRLYWATHEDVRAALRKAA